MPRRPYCVYILASRSRETYIGITGNLVRRLAEHRLPSINPRAFTARHRTSALVHVELFSDPETAIRREKQLKHWTRRRKLALIEAGNPTFRDLSWEIGFLS